MALPALAAGSPGDATWLSIVTYIDSNRNARAMDYQTAMSMLRNVNTAKFPGSKELGQKATDGVAGTQHGSAWA